MLGVALGVALVLVLVVVVVLEVEVAALGGLGLAAGALGIVFEIIGMLASGLPLWLACCGAFVLSGELAGVVAGTS